MSPLTNNATLHGRKHRGTQRWNDMAICTKRPILRGKEVQGTEEPIYAYLPRKQSHEQSSPNKWNSAHLPKTQSHVEGRTTESTCLYFYKTQCYPEKGWNDQGMDTSVFNVPKEQCYAQE